MQLTRPSSLFSLSPVRPDVVTSIKMSREYALLGNYGTTPPHPPQLPLRCSALGSRRLHSSHFSLALCHPLSQLPRLLRRRRRQDRPVSPHFPPLPLFPSHPPPPRLTFIPAPPPSTLYPCLSPFQFHHRRARSSPARQMDPLPRRAEQRVPGHPRHPAHTRVLPPLPLLLLASTTHLPPLLRLPLLSPRDPFPLPPRLPPLLPPLSPPPPPLL